MAENVVKMKKEKIDASEKVGSFVSKYRKTILFSAIAVIVIAVAVCVSIAVIENTNEKGISAMDAIEYVFTKDSASLSEDELATRQNTAMDALKPYLNKKNVVGVRANMLAASIAFEKKDFENSRTYWIAAANAGKKSYTSPVCNFNAGVCSEELGDNEKAIEYYTTASDSEDFLLVTHCLFSLGRVKESVSDFTGASEVYQKLVDNYPNDDWTKLAQSRIISLSAEGKISDATASEASSEVTK